jgi:formate-dependent nitrite reductase membrane component NrfD
MPIQWPIVIFKLLVCGGTGVLGFVGISQLFGDKEKAKSYRVAVTMALLMIVVGGAMVLFQVAKPAQIMAVARNITSGSPTSLEFLAFLISLIVGIIYLFLVMRDEVVSKIMGAVGIIVALSMGLMSGYSHMAMTGSPAWHTPSIPISFLASGLLLGGFVYLAVAGKSVVEDKKLIKAIGTILIVLAVVTIASEVFYGLYASLGAAAVLYWCLAPLVGGGVSAIAAGLEIRRPSIIWVFVGLAATSLGGLILRAMVWYTNIGMSPLLRG